MNGTIPVLNQPSSLSANKQNSTANSTTNSNVDTVGTYMVPAKDLSKDIAALTNGGLSVDSILYIQRCTRRRKRNWA